MNLYGHGFGSAQRRARRSDQRWARWFAVFWGGAVVLLLWAGSVLAQDANEFFNRTRDPAGVSQRVRLALPAAERGLALLTSGDPSQLAPAVESIRDTYKYLRAAQESTADLERWSKFPDPLAEMKIARMWTVRKHTLACTLQAGHIINQSPEMISMCAREMTEGVRELRVLLAVMP